MTDDAVASWRTRVADELAATAILTDFDGTLSQIVVDPSQARPLTDAVETLETLAEHANTVAVISGRPLDFLTAHFDGRLVLAGLYGLEICRDGVVERARDVERWRAVIDQTADQARRDLPAEVVIEPKGLAITLHYRAAPEHRGIIEQWARRRSAATGLRVAQARCSVELNPPLAVDKGTVVAQLAEAPGIRHACYLGDDRADLAAFDALGELRTRGVDTFTVAVEGAETPVDVLHAADLVVPGPQAALAFLRSLLPAI